MGSIAIAGPDTNGASNDMSCIFPTLTDGFIPDLIKCRETGRQTYPLDLGPLGEVEAIQSDREAAVVAGWALTLAKYVGTEGVSVHVLRKRASTQSSAMCSLTVDRSLTQRQLLAQAHEYLDGTRWHQVPGEKGSAPLLPGSISSDYANTAIVFEDKTGEEAGQCIEYTEKDEGFLIVVISNDGTGRIAAYLSYHHSLITDGQAANVVRTFTKVLSGLIADPDIVIDHVDYMSQAHLDQIWQFNSDVPEPWMECFHDVVERHAVSQPHAPAIDAWDGKFTYKELSSWSKSLAKDLQDQGVRPGVVVPICFERSAWAPVAMLAVSKAGGGFVSIPPSLPPGRIDAIMKIIECPLILTKSIHGHLWEGRMNWMAIEDHHPCPSAAPTALAQATDLFYVIFTSGSTGVPKGCMVSHTSWLNGALRNAPNWNYGPDGRVLQMLNHTFDMSLLEICTSLGSGACVCIPSAEEVEESLVGVINKYNVTQTIMTPSLARALTPEAIPGLKTMCLGGEPFPKEIVTVWAEQINLFQFYGPCECSINSSYRAIPRKDADPLTIGYPNCCACWVVESNNHNELVPIGAIGELLVSGPVVGMGYWKDPVKTAQVFLDKVDFIKDDHPVFSGFRFYKTGDLVRWNSDGTLSFCGRADMEVKLNGQRLELAEVEYHLSLDGDVQLATALLPDIGRCRKNLVAVLTLKTTAESSSRTAEIRLLDGRKDQSIRRTTRKIWNRLQKVLPHYMVPTIWVFLASMPMSESGKIDRVRVRKWVEGMSEDTFATVTGKGFDPADKLEYMTHMEQEIQQIWGEVLGLSASQVGLNQSFIALGGDSIKALEMVAKCRVKGIYITMADILPCEGVSEAAFLCKSTAIDNTNPPQAEGSFHALWAQLRDGYDLSKLGISRLDDVEDVYPCTKMQEGCFLGQIRRPGAYHMRFFYKINAKDGRLPDVDRIKAAWYSVVAIHPSLRTIFVEDLVSDAIYHSIVLRQPSLELHIQEIPDTPPSEALKMFTHSPVLPFDSRLPQHRLKILSSRGRVPYFMLEISHAIMDGSSLAIFVGDFMRACSGKQLFPGGSVYRDFVMYQRKQVTEQSAEYWKSYLEGCPPCLFPVTTSQDAEPDPARMRRDFWFERSVAFIARCNQRHITTACAIRAAWAIVLREYAGSQDVCFGYVVALRNVPIKDISRMFGVCISTQPCHVRIRPETTMVELAKNIQNDFLDAVPHQHYPLAETLQRLHPNGGQPMFNTILSMEWIPPVDADADSTIELEEMREQDDPAEYDIGISVDVQGGRIKLGFLHWPWITDFEITHLANAFKRAMSFFIDHPDKRVDSLSLVNTNDVAAMMNGLNTIHPLEATDSTVLTYIRQQSMERPTAPAIEAWDGRISYQQLEEEYTIIARDLVRRGIGRGDTVLFCMDRSSWAVVIMLGILRSGAVFIASSSESPRQRLQTLIHHCRPRLVIADHQYMELFEGMTSGVTPIDLVDAASLRGLGPLDTPLPSLHAHDLVYIVYTSGSTGEPKGIMIEHSSLATSVVVGHGKTFRYSTEVRFLQFTSLTFDIAMMEIFTTLAYGGCICIPSEEERLSDLAGCMNRLQVNTAILTPSVSRVFSPKDVPTLTRLGLGGEPMTRQDLERLANVVDVYNGFGPSEATILVSSYGPMKSTDEPNNIGYAVGGTRLWVTEVDNAQQLAPIGCVGELVIESRQLARGYLHDDERTKTAFIESPPWLGPGTRVYKTGDLVRYAPDGSLRYLGRKDTQVKLRGQRIELSQIEHHINVCWPHAHVVVEVIAPKGGSKDEEMLAAFLNGVADADVEYIKETIPTAEHGDDTARPVMVPAFVSEYLAKNLANYMIPSVFFAIPNMPIIISGKVDRRRLRQMGAALSNFRLPQSYKGLRRDEWASMSELECRLLELWTQMLHLEPARVRLDDSFFQLGGNSITAMKLTAAARQQGIRFTVPQLFRHPTIRKLASALRQELPAPTPQQESEPVKKALQDMLDQIDQTALDDNEFLELAAANLVALARKKGRNLDLANVSERIQAKISMPGVEESKFQEDEPFSLLSDEDHVQKAIFRAATEQCQVRRGDIEELYPATPLQEGMISLTARQLRAYTSVLTFELPASINLDQFQAAWRTAAHAHPILRTRIIQTETHGTFQVVLCRPLLTVEQYSETEILPDLTTDMGLGTPLLRLAVVRGCSHVTSVRLILAIHHALYDGWSLPLLKAEVEAAYNGSKLQKRPFKPFIAYLDQSKSAAEEFWRAQLNSFDCTTFPSLPLIGYQVAQNAELNQNIPLLQTEHDRFTLSTKVRLAWAITISRYTAIQDVVFGVTTAGRAVPVVGIEWMLGPTIATIPLRIRVDINQGVVPMLEVVQDQSLQSLEHEHLGLQHIARLGPSQAAACQFQTLIVIQSGQREEASTIFAGQQILPDLGAETYALVLICEPALSTVNVRAKYDSQVIDQDLMIRILNHLEHVLAQLFAEPEISISQLEVLSQPEWRTLLAWNPPVPSLDHCVHEKIHEWSLTQPDALSVCAWDGNWSYGQLDKLTFDLAQQLRSEGVGPEMFVPLYFERSRWVAIAMVAVMKAGGIFMLLDPTHPPNRLRDLVQQVHPPLLLASKEQSRPAQSHFGVKVITVGDEIHSWCLSPCRPTASTATARNGCYAVFTSGSTGPPKRSVAEHRAVFCSLSSIVRRFQLDRASRVLQFSSFAFDVSIMEHLGAFLAGGCVCIPSEFDRRNALTKAINDLHVNWAFLTPSLLRTIHPQEIPRLQNLVILGEPPTQEDYEIWTASVNLIQAYGVTECSILATITDRIKATDNPRNIGKPSACRCWVADQEDHNKPVPIGAIGELIIEGPIVNQGYLGDAEQTAVSFIPYPKWLTRWQEGRESRVYKTGDLVRYGLDGCLLYVGRKDTQVKLHGQRIELPEVETHLHGVLPSARDIIVEVVVDGDGGPPRLTAFIWSNQQSNSSSTTGTDRGEARFLLPTSQFLSEMKTAERALSLVMPAYMVPVIYIPVSSIPLSNSGKADRRRLKEMVVSCSRRDLQRYTTVQEQKKQAPLTEKECLLQDIWARVLNVNPDTIGVHDDFFRMGGDSITGMQAATKCNTLGLAVNSADLFRYRTISRLVAHLQTQEQDTSAQILSEEEFDEWFELSPIQQMFFEHEPEGLNYFNQSFLFCTGEHLESNQVALALESIVSRHSMLRARFRKSSHGKWDQAVTESTKGCYRFQAHQVASKKELADICTASQHSLHILRGPLLAADLIDLENGEQYLSVAAHQLVVDLVSWRVLHSDLEEHLRFGSASAVASMPFQTWCRAQAEYSSQSLPPSIALPQYRADEFAAADYWGITKDCNIIGDVEQQGFHLDQPTTAIIVGVANEAFRTQPVEIMQATLLHSFVQTFPNRRCPTIYTEEDGREPWDPAMDITRTVGWFTTMSPLTVQLQPTDSIIDIVRSIKDARRRIPARGWAYFASRYFHLEGRRVFGQQAPMEILFNYMGPYQPSEGAAVLQVVSDNQVPSVADSMRRFALIDVSAQISEGCLQVHFVFPRGMKHQPLLRQWFKACQLSLLEAATKLPSLRPRGTLSDFPLLSLTYDQLDEFMHHTLSQHGINPDEVEDIYPCSPMQRGILLSQIRDSQYYQNRLLLEIVPSNGNLAVDIERLQNAWQQVINRHAVFRTLFLAVSHEGLADQVVLKAADPQIDIDTGRSGPALDSKTTSSKAKPDHRVLLRTLPSGSVLWEWRFNHALVDAMSIAIIQRDLTLAYEGRLSPEYGPQYREYIEYLQHVDQESARSYWEKYLEGIIEPCFLPRLTGGSSSDNEKRKVRSISVELDRRANIREICREYGLTLTNIFHIAWALVLRCYLATDSVCFGYLIFGRDIPLPGVETIVGPLMNTLVTQVYLPSQSSLRSVLQRNQENLVNSHSHRYYSLADLYHSKKLSGSSLFNTGISVQDLTRYKMAEKASIEIKPVEGDDPAEFDVTVNIGVGEGQIDMTLIYWTSIMSDDQAITISQTFCRALDEVLQQQAKRICDLDCVGEECKRQTAIWNAILPGTVDEVAHDLIRQQCKMRSDAEAVCGWDGSFTFRELDELSSRLALYLIQLGLPIMSVVPIYTEKSRWAVIAILGVLKAGAAFTLLDVCHPLVWLEEVCRDINTGFILSSHSTAGRAAHLASTVVAVGEDTATTWPRNNSQCSPRAVTPKSPAYVIFTSGSTGKPKGVLIDHGSLSTNARAISTRLGISSTSRILQFSSYAFDLSVLENLITLSVGGCVCIPSELERRDKISEAMVRMKVNFASITPSIARIINQETLHGLKNILVCGEPPSPEDMETLPGTVQVINGYGPAECTILCATSAYIPEDPRVIGRGIGCATWIVDRHDHQKLVPIGAIGELMIEGPAVSSGYINAPAKDAAAFVKYPSWLSQLRKGKEGRLYRTGDLVQYRSDGTIRFMGRKDNQIKLRGQRIELNEVEHRVQKAFPRARNTVVDIITPSTSSKRSAFLVAFVLQRSNYLQYTANESLFEAPSAEFRADVAVAETRLRHSLPAYMVPAVFLPLTRIPQTLSCKTDRKLLQHYAAALSVEDIYLYSAAMIAKRPPLTLMETKLQQLLSRLLGLPLDKIGMDDDFFRLGGDSVGSMRLVSMAREEGVVLSVVDIFEHPNISDLALAATPAKSKSRGVTQRPCSLLKTSPETEILDRILVGQPFDARDVVDVLPTTEFQRDWLNKTCTYLVLDVPGRISRDRLNTAVQELVNAHEILRTVFIPFQHSIVQVILRKIDIPVQIVETDTPELIPFSENTCQQDSATAVPFGAPPFKATLISRGENRHAVILRLSHAQYDGLSMPVLFTDLGKAYDGRPLLVTASYTDYLLHRTQQKSAQAFQFWRDLLHDSSMTYLDSASLGGHDPGDNHPETLIIRVRRLSISSPPKNVTIATVFKAAWALVLAQETRTHDLVFRQVVNGRNLALEGVDQVLGPCVNIVPIRATIQPYWTVQDLLKDLQSQHAQTIPFETLDFEDIATHCTNWRSGTRSGTVVQHQNIDLTPEISLAGIKCRIHARVFDHRTKDLYVESTPDASNPNVFTVRLITSSTMVDENGGDRLLEQLCDVFTLLIAEPDRLLTDMGLYY